ncbi:MAG: hypothetical protein MJE63_05445 [Proteobacteria bacterium]|nr:hypothetical protein [Pseudomonadota bacterium]
MEDWKNWMNSSERQNIQKQIDQLTGEETEYRYYEPIVGGISPQFKSPV